MRIVPFVLVLVATLIGCGPDDSVVPSDSPDASLVLDGTIDASADDAAEDASEDAMTVIDGDAIDADVPDADTFDADVPDADTFDADVPDAMVVTPDAAIDAPTVTSISVSMGPTSGGTSVTIVGTAFTSTASVSFGSTPAANVTFVSSTELTVTSPAGSAGTVDITVTTEGGTSATSSADEFTYVAPPTVTSISPTFGPTSGGTSVTISGAGVLAALSVYFGSEPAESLSTMAGDLIAIAPANLPGAVHITVIGLGGTSTETIDDLFTYYDAPTVTGISPAVGSESGGTTVTVTGTGFTPASTVTFGTEPGTSVNVMSATILTVVSPSGAAATVDITVTNEGGTSATSSAAQFTYVAPPTVTSLDTTTGGNPGGTSVVITGTGFTGATSVLFGATDATAFTVDSDTQITATSPVYLDGAGVVDVTVANAYGTSAISAASEFTYETRPIIFVTSGTWNGNLGGFSGADAKCNADANKPSTGFAASYTYKALLNGNNATTSGVTYYRTNGTTNIATATGGNLIGGASLVNSIGTASGASWTGATNNCSSWTSSTNSTSGTTGNHNSTTSTWWSIASPFCNSARPLYCVSQ